MAQQDQMMAAAASIQRALAAYRRNPDMFSDDDVAQLKTAADQYGMSFNPNFSMKRALEHGAFQLADTALLGLLPNEWDTDPLSSGEKAAGILGEALGFAVPGIAAYKGASALQKGMTKYGSRVGKKVWASKAAARSAYNSIPGTTLLSRISPKTAKELERKALAYMLKSRVPGFAKYAGDIAGMTLPFTNLNTVRTLGTVGGALTLNDILDAGSGMDEEMMMQEQMY